MSHPLGMRGKRRHGMGQDGAAFRRRVDLDTWIPLEQWDSGSDLICPADKVPFPMGWHPFHRAWPKEKPVKNSQIVQGKMWLRVQRQGGKEVL